LYVYGFCFVIRLLRPSVCPSPCPTILLFDLIKSHLSLLLHTFVFRLSRKKIFFSIVGQFSTGHFSLVNHAPSPSSNASSTFSWATATSWPTQIYVAIGAEAYLSPAVGDCSGTGFPRAGAPCWKKNVDCRVGGRATRIAVPFDIE